MALTVQKGSFSSMTHLDSHPPAQAVSVAERLPNRGWRVLLSLFILLNIATVQYMNLPRDLTAKKQAEWTSKWDPMMKYRLSVANWRWQQYAHLAGLDNVWQMFGKQSYFNWRYDIRGVYGSGEAARTVLLPLPGQSERTLAQRYLVDFRERKFELNIYRSDFARKAYMRYLARQHPVHEGLPLSEIRWKVAFQNILPPAEAVKQQKLVSDEWHEIDYGRYNPTQEVPR